MLKQILLVGAGGAVGSIMRYLISEITYKYGDWRFPISTFAVNLIGCFCIGLLISVLSASSNFRFLLIAGFCGGFTTFSAFALETYQLVESNQMLLAFIYTLISCVFGICAVWLGMYIAK